MVTFSYVCCLVGLRLVAMLMRLSVPQVLSMELWLLTLLMAFASQLFLPVLRRALLICGTVSVVIAMFPSLSWIAFALI